MVLSKKENNQKLLILTVCLMLSFPPICLFVNLLCGAFFGEAFSLDTLACYLVLVCMVIGSLWQVLGRIKIDVLLVVMAFILAYAISYSFFEENRKYMFTEWGDFNGNPAYQLFAFSLPAYVLIRYITDYDRLFDTFYGFSIAVVLCSIGTFLLLAIDDAQPQYMDFSYNLLFSILFLTVYFIEKKKKLCLLVAIVGVGLVFFAGARGPLLCYCIGLVVYLFMRKTPISRKLITIIFVAIACLIVMVLWQQILTLLQSFVNLLGINSRSIEMLIKGEFSNDSGRGEIQREIASKFTLFGSGIFGDRVAGNGHYAHNLLLELISQWGYLLGVVIVASLIILFCCGIRTPNYSLRLLILILLATGFVKLMLSGSYLNFNPAFFLLVGACMNAGEMKRKEPKTIASSRLSAYRFKRRAI